MNRLDELEWKLAEETRNVMISSSIEVNLLAEFDCRKQSRVVSFPVAAIRYGLSATAILTLAACLLLMLRSHPKPETKAVAQVRTPATEARALSSIITAPKLKAVRRPRPRKPGEVEAEFQRIPYSEDLAPYEQAEIIRVELPVSALAAVGLRIATHDTGAKAQADVIVGEDGMAHAVRLISISSN